MTKELLHAVLLVLSIALMFIFPDTPLRIYELEIAAGLFIVLFIVRKLSLFSKKTRLFESIVFTLIIMGIVNTTGGISSPYFFLVYFLLFALSLLLEPIISIITTVTLMILYVFSIPGNASVAELIPVFSLALMTPFALIMGNEYEETKRLRNTMAKQTENTFLFLSLMMKNHIKSIQEQIDNFVGDHQLQSIQKSVTAMRKQIDMFEKQQ